MSTRDVSATLKKEKEKRSKLETWLRIKHMHARTQAHAHEYIPNTYEEKTRGVFITFQYKHKLAVQDSVA